MKSNYATGLSRPDLSSRFVSFRNIWTRICRPRSSPTSPICRSYHFHRVFSGLVGESPAEHRSAPAARARAAGELCRTNRRVIDVALGAGYGAHEPFTRAFRAHFGVATIGVARSRGALVFPPVAVRRPLMAPTKRSPLRRSRGGHENDRSSHRNCSGLGGCLALSHTGSYLDVGKAFERLMTTAGSRGLLGPDSKAIGIYTTIRRRSLPPSCEVTRA